MDKTITKISFADSEVDAVTVKDIRFQESEVDAITIRQPRKTGYIREAIAKPPQKDKTFHIPSSLRNFESYKQGLGSLRPSMDMAEFRSLTSEREAEPLTFPSLEIGGKILINVPYADGRTEHRFDGLNPPRGFRKACITLRGQKTMIFLTTSQVDQVDGTPGLRLY